MQGAAWCQKPMFELCSHVAACSTPSLLPLAQLATVPFCSVTAMAMETMRGSWKAKAWQLTAFTWSLGEEVWRVKIRHFRSGAGANPPKQHRTKNPKWEHWQGFLYDNPKSSLQLSVLLGFRAPRHVGQNLNSNLRCHRPQSQCGSFPTAQVSQYSKKETRHVQPRKHCNMFFSTRWRPENFGRELSRVQLNIESPLAVFCKTHDRATFQLPKWKWCFESCFCTHPFSLGLPFF